MRYTARQLKNTEWDVTVGLPDGRWLPARPMSFTSWSALCKRIVDAWRVLTGRYDVIDWEY